MRRTLVMVCSALLGLAAVPVAATAGTRTQASMQPVQGQPTHASAQPVHAQPAQASIQPAHARLRANRQAARRDARRLLKHLDLPHNGVTATGRLPRFARGFALSPSPTGSYYASDQSWERTSATPNAIIAYVRRHPPAGSTPDAGTGSGSDTKTGVTSLDLQFSWPDLTRRVIERTLTVTVLTPRRGESVVVARSQSAWFVPRSAGERVPDDVHALVITLRLGPAATGPIVKPGGHMKTTTHVIWRPAAVRTLVRRFNGLAIVQPATEPIGCPLMLSGSSASELTVAFKTGRGGVTVARAQVFIRRGQTGADGAGPCNPIDFWLGGRQRAPLISTTFVRHVGKLIHVNIS